MKKQEKKSKKLLWAVLAVILVIGATVSALLLSGVFGGNAEPEATEPIAQEENKIYWNVARTRYVAKGIQGTSSRTPSADGYYYVKMAVEGEQVDIKVADLSVVNAIDFQEIMGLTFDETGVCTGVLSVEEATGGRVRAKKWPVESVTNEKMVCNTSVKLKGYHVEIPLN